MVACHLLLQRGYVPGDRPLSEALLPMQATLNGSNRGCGLHALGHYALCSVVQGCMPQQMRCLHA